MGRVDRYASLRGEISLPGLGEPMANIPELTHVRIKCLNAGLVIQNYGYRKLIDLIKASELFEVEMPE